MREFSILGEFLGGYLFNVCVCPTHEDNIYNQFLIVFTAILAKPIFMTKTKNNIFMVKT